MMVAMVRFHQYMINMLTENVNKKDMKKSFTITGIVITPIAKRLECEKASSRITYTKIVALILFCKCHKAAEPFCTN